MVSEADDVSNLYELDYNYQIVNIY